MSIIDSDMKVIAWAGRHMYSLSLPESGSSCHFRAINWTMTMENANLVDQLDSKEVNVY